MDSLASLKKFICLHPRPKDSDNSDPGLVYSQTARIVPLYPVYLGDISYPGIEAIIKHGRGKEHENRDRKEFSGKEREMCVGKRVGILSSRAVSSSLLVEGKNSVTFRYSELHHPDVFCFLDSCSLRRNSSAKHPGNNSKQIYPSETILARDMSRLSKKGLVCMVSCSCLIPPHLHVFCLNNTFSFFFMTGEFRRVCF